MPEKQPGWDKPIYSQFDDCGHEGGDCLSYAPDDLCNHYTVDHNYYAICRNLLSEYSREGWKAGGLLQGIPEDIEQKWQISKLVQECAQPPSKDGRLKSKETLFSALKEIRKDVL